MRKLPGAPLPASFPSEQPSIVSPESVAELFGFQLRELREKAGVRSNLPTAPPDDAGLDRFLDDLLRLLEVAVALTGSVERAVFLIRYEPLRTFAGRTAFALVEQGLADDAIAYLESLGAGAAG